MDHNPLDTAPSVTASRRRMLQTAVALATLAVVSDRQRSLARRGWCRSDPVIAIEGVIVDIFCTAPETAPLYVTGPTEIVVSVPVGVSTELVLKGVGFGRGERVSFKELKRLKQSDEAVEVEVKVYVPANKKLPIGVEFAHNLVGILEPTTAEGVTNEWITLKTHLPTDADLVELSSERIVQDQ